MLQKQRRHTGVATHARGRGALAPADSVHVSRQRVRLLLKHFWRHIASRAHAFHHFPKESHASRPAARGTNTSKAAALNAAGRGKMMCRRGGRREVHLSVWYAAAMPKSPTCSGSQHNKSKARRHREQEEGGGGRRGRRGVVIKAATLQQRLLVTKMFWGLRSLQQTV